MERKTPSKHAKKMRRIKRTYKHPNPLFEKWLLEWKEEAVERHSNMKYNFQRALKSLRQFPLPLKSGKECKILAHFGDKICTMLDKKLEKYIEDNGPVVWEDHIQVVENVYKKKTKSKSSRQGAGGLSGSQSETKSSRLQVSAEDSDSDESLVKGKQKQKRPYVPAVRSGAYALLVALYQGMEERSLEFMTKTQLIEAAQPLADCSFMHSAEGSYYTAWSSMSTLVKKGLVTKESNPAKFCLTLEGKELAERLLGVESHPTMVRTSVPSKPTSSPMSTSSTSSWQCERNVSPEEVVILSSRSNSPFDLTNKKLIHQQSPSSHSSSPPYCLSPEYPPSSAGLSPVHCPTPPGCLTSPVCPEVKYSLSPPKPPSPLCLSPCKPSPPQCVTLDSCPSPFQYPSSPLHPPSPLPPSSSQSPHNCSMSPHSPSSLSHSPSAHSASKPQKNFPTEFSFLHQPLLCEEGSLTETTKGSVFVFSYVDGRDIETSLKDKAMASVEDDGFFGFLIKCRLTDLEKSTIEYRIDYTRSAPIGYIYAYIADSSAPDVSPGLHTPPKAKGSHSSSDQHGNTPVKQKEPPKLKRKEESPEMDIKNIIPNKRKSSKTINNVYSESVNSLKSLMSDNNRKDGLEMSKVKSDVPVESLKTKSQELGKPKFFLAPEQYEVLLCVDNAETTGGFSGHKKGAKDIIITELKKNGVNFDVRKLHIGDFLWVCREKVLPVPGRLQAPKAKELVLPYIIERKRMDDLASSIRDGRFKEQKFRLKQTGLACPIYLVESYGSQHLSLPESTCEQAVVNTQIVDGFTVKCTVDQRESAAYLTIMTRYLQSKYQNKRLECYAKDDLTETMKQCTTKLMSFEEMNSSSVKNRQLTVKEMFAKHLMQLHGLSATKAKVIVDQYGTPATLLKALQSCSENSREHILADLKCTKTNRKIGQVIGSTICKLYSMPTIQ